MVLIAMVYVCVIVGTHWLSRFGVVIDCERQTVTIRDPSGGVLTVYAEGIDRDQLFAMLPGRGKVYSRSAWAF